MPFARRVVIAALVAVAVSATAQAQTPPARLRGTIGAIDATTLTLTTNAGATVKVALKPDTPVIAVVPAKLGDISKGSFIGTAAMPGPNGSFVALEVHIFPEAMRGAGEGHYPFDLKPESTMTNGTVGDVTVANGDTLTVGYKGGQSTIMVPADVPIVAFAPGDRGMLAVGAHAIAFAAKQADGSYAAIRVLVGKDGLVPPM
jgi:hypothetical protein